MNIEIKNTKNKGKGVFAKRNFKENEKIYAYQKGKIVNSLNKIQPSDRAYVDIIGNGKYEVIEPPARYINHSCNPNVKEQRRVGYALRDILSGEELTIDYADVAYLEFPMLCQCEEANCRKTIRNKSNGY